MTLFPTITLTIAAILSTIVLCNCRFVEGVKYSTYGIYYSYNSWTGFWPGCYGYRDDPARKAAMSFGLIACIFGTGAMIALWSITCKPYKVVWIRIIFGVVVFAFISQLATLSILGSYECQPYGCSLGWGGIMSIIAAIFWLIGAIAVWMISKPIEPNSSTTNIHATNVVKATETVTITETVQPDGSKVTETITTSFDGTKTIETTIERNLATSGGMGGMRPRLSMPLLSGRAVP